MPQLLSVWMTEDIFTEKEKRAEAIRKGDRLKLFVKTAGNGDCQKLWKKFISKAQQKKVLLLRGLPVIAKNIMEGMWLLETMNLKLLVQVAPARQEKLKAE